MLDTLTDEELVAEAKRCEETSSESGWGAADCYAELQSREFWTQTRIAEECGVSRQHVGFCLVCVRNCYPGSNRPSFREAYREAQGKPAVNVSQNTGQPEWYTPAEYVEAARKVLGDIDLDPASSRIAQRTVQAKTFFTAAQDGLSKRWHGRVWLNPPYAADKIGPFVKKLCGHVATGEVTAALLLVNNATETSWFQEAGELCVGLCFPSGRIHFLDEQGNPKRAPLQGQAILYFGLDAELFFETFVTFGFCARMGENESAGTSEVA